MPITERRARYYLMEAPRDERARYISGLTAEERKQINQFTFKTQKRDHDPKQKSKVTSGVLSFIVHAAIATSTVKEMASNISKKTTDSTPSLAELKSRIPQLQKKKKKPPRLPLEESVSIIPVKDEPIQLSVAVLLRQTIDESRAVIQEEEKAKKQITQDGFSWQKEKKGFPVIGRKSFFSANALLQLEGLTVYADEATGGVRNISHDEIAEGKATFDISRLFGDVVPIARGAQRLPGLRSVWKDQFDPIGTIEISVENPSAKFRLHGASKPDQTVGEIQSLAEKIAGGKKSKDTLRGLLLGKNSDLVQRLLEDN